MSSLVVWINLCTRMELKYFYLNLFLYQDMPDMLSPEACHRKNSPELDATQRKQYFWSSAKSQE